jgi:nucleotide-binding universal stress UspA family protein
VAGHNRGPSRPRARAHPDFPFSPIVVGVTADQDPAVVARAAELAGELSAPLICAYVDPASYLLEWSPDEQILPMSLEPSVEPDDDVTAESRRLRKILAETLDPLEISWTLRVLAGEPALALGRLAASAGASLIVVGSRRAGLLARMEELLNGSVALRLMSTQHLPVLGVPVSAQPGTGHR